MTETLFTESGSDSACDGKDLNNNDSGGGHASEEYELDGHKLRRRVRLGGLVVESWVAADATAMATDSDVLGQSELKSIWWNAYLNGVVPVCAQEPDGVLRTVDLFSGVGGLALGVGQFASEAGRTVSCELAVDTDASALRVHRANHRTRICSSDSVSSLVDFRLRDWAEDAAFVYEPEIVDEQAAAWTRGVDLVMAGPPCQGHSNLNNRSRREDPRNLLYLTVPAFAVAAGAGAVIIENVPSVVHDRTRVVHTARRLLESSGYTVTEAVLAADAMGWPQTRKRFIMAARRDPPPIPLDQVASLLTEQLPRSVRWAIGDDRAVTGHDIVDQPAGLNVRNQERIDWLFDNDAYDLDLAQRPECHQDGTTYRSVYGRMRPDEPSGTITTGFMTPGRGRYVHHSEPRTLTPAEAARLQGFPRNFRWVTDTAVPPSRTQLAKWIGNAVPMPIGYGAAFAALGPLIAMQQH